MSSSMASLIRRAAARAGSFAAWAASRCATAAAAARSAGLGRAAASDPITRASSSVAAAATTARSPASSGSPVAARRPRSSLDNRSGSTIDWEVFKADEKDLESDEALMALYERWCKYFNEERSRDEMARRFSAFKETVLVVEENKKSDLPYRFAINQFADGKLGEIYSKANGTGHIKDIPYSTSVIYGRVPDFVLKGGPSDKGPGQVAGATQALNPSHLHEHDHRSHI